MNYPISNPADWLTRLAALEAELIASGPNVDQSIVGGRLFFAPLATPAAPTLVVTGGAAGTQSYKVVALLGTGRSSASLVGTTSAGPTTLNATHFNTLTWAAVPGATSYNVYRTAGGAAQGLIANVLAPLTSLVDNGLVADSTSAPALASSGILSAIIQQTVTIYGADGAISALGSAIITKGTAAALTLEAPIAGAPSAGGMDGAVVEIVSTTAAAHTVTTPSNAINGADHVATFATAVGNYIRLRAYNGVWYMVGSTGVTLS